MPSISIIVPIYNSEEYLCRCVDSILTQTFMDFELLLIDDGSTDLSGCICDEYATRDSRIRVFHKRNEGVSSARNVGIKNAHGFLIMFVDSDDYLNRDCLEVIISKIGDADLLMFSNLIFFEDGGETILRKKTEELNGKIVVEKYIYQLKQNNHQNWEFYGYVWNKVYKLNVIRNNNIKFTTGLSYREDNLFNEAYYRCTERMIVVSDVLYNYRFSTSGLTYKAISQRDWLCLARGLDRLTDDISYAPLKAFDKKHIFDYYLLGSFPSAYTSVRLFDEIRHYIKSNAIFELTVRQSLAFTGNVIKNYCFYVMLYYLPYVKEQMVKVLKRKTK